MAEFKHKTYRCEWQLCFITVDQYGRTSEINSVIPFPTLEEATAARPIYANEHQWVKGRWVPKDAAHEYLEVDIRYQEVEVK